MEDADRSIVLLFDPADAFSCFSGLAAWNAWSSESGNELTLIFTRSPTPVERRLLRFAGIREDGLLSESKSLNTPIHLVFEAGVVRDVREHTTDEDAFATIAGFRSEIRSGGANQFSQADSPSTTGGHHEQERH